MSPSVSVRPVVRGDAAAWIRMRTELWPESPGDHPREVSQYFACEAWARSRGCTELGSDRALDNRASGAFHLATGFDEVGRVVSYRKEL